MKAMFLLLHTIIILFIFFCQTSAAEIISIPHQACLPKQHWSTSLITYYHSNGASIQPYPGSGEQVLYCPIILPNGSTIKRVTMEGHDHTGGVSGGNLTAGLCWYKYNSTYGPIASFNTGAEEAPGDTRVSVDSINLIIDNSEYHYGISVGMNNPTGDAGAISFSKFIIEYDPPATSNKVTVIPLPIR